VVGAVDSEDIVDGGCGAAAKVLVEWIGMLESEIVVRVMLVGPASLCLPQMRVRIG